jgi:hypothetical protein
MAGCRQAHTFLAEDSFVDVFAAGCDAGIRYDERLEQDMIAVPIGPRVQRFAAAAARATLRPTAAPSTPATCLSIAACGPSSPAAPNPSGSLNATAKPCASTLSGAS